MNSSKRPDAAIDSCELPHQPLKGRGAIGNGAGRFESRTHVTWDDGWSGGDNDQPSPRTTLTRDDARSIIARNDSPDVPFSRSVNPYRGCEHGCVYCFARPSHHYLGLSSGLDFETRIFHKPRAAELLEGELRRPGYRCETIALGSNTDPYQPAERKLGVTRSVLQVLRDYRHPVGIVTKSALVERDLDILAPMAARRLVRVYLSVTTLDDSLARKLEPRAAAPRRRLETLGRLSEQGIPTGVLFAPVIPALNEAEMENILAAAREAGAAAAGYVMLRLPHDLGPLFEDWLFHHVPDKARHVMSLIRELRGGRLNHTGFGRRMRGEGVFADLIADRFRLARRRLGYPRRAAELDAGQFRVPVRSGDQLALF